MQRGVEQHPGQHLLVVHRLRDVVDGGQACRVRPVLTGFIELDVPDPPQLAAGIQEIDQAAADAAHGRDVELAGADRLAERIVEQQLGAFERGGGVVDFQSERANRRAMRDIEGMREAFLLGVDDEVDAALMPARHGLRLVTAGAAKAERREHVLELGSAGIVDGKLHELRPEGLGSRRQLGDCRERCLGSSVAS